MFDVSVKQAVQDFQKKNGISPNNGRFGPATRAKMNSLYGCKEVSPSITITAPNGGERWQIGQTYPVTWNSVNVDRDVFVSIKNETTDKVTSSVAPVPVKDGSYSFTIDPSDYTVGDRYKATVGYGQDENRVSDSSDNYFSISVADSSVDSIGSASSVSSNTTATSSPTIKLTSPNGGEAWQNGQNHSSAFTYSGAN